MTNRVYYVLATIVAALMLSLSGIASAKIEPVCQNPAGGEPQGQCKGSALTEENQNPSGKAPPGQNR